MCLRAPSPWPVTFPVRHGVNTWFSSQSLKLQRFHLRPPLNFQKTCERTPGKSVKWVTVHTELSKCASDLNTCGTLEEDPKKKEKNPQFPECWKLNVFPIPLKPYIVTVKGGRFSLGQFHDIITDRQGDRFSFSCQRRDPQQEQQIKYLETIFTWFLSGSRNCGGFLFTLLTTVL